MKRLLPALLVLLTACSQAQNIQWVPVIEDTLIIGVDIEGTLQATDSASIGPPGIPSEWEFAIADLIEDGEAVEKGAALVTFDGSKLTERLAIEENRRDSLLVTLEKRRFEIALATQNEQLQLAEAQASVRKAALGAEQSADFTGNLIIETAKLDLEAARETAEHQRAQLRRKQANNRREIANRESQVASAEKTVTQLQSEIQMLSIVAPRAGTAVVNENRGTEKFKVGDTVWRSEMLLSVASLDRMMAEATVDEADFGQLSVGQEVHLRLEAHPDNEVNGSLKEIARSVQSKSWNDPVKVAKVKLDIVATNDLKLKPGMRFRGEVETERIDKAVIVPLSSVFSSQEGPIAFRRVDGTAVRQPLVLGKRGKRGVQVLKGLSATDQVSRFDLRRIR